MGSKYQTTNENIVTTANVLKSIAYQELNATDKKELCDFLVISHVDKKFFFTKHENRSHFENLLKTLN